MFNKNDIVRYTGNNPVLKSYGNLVIDCKTPDDIYMLYNMNKKSSRHILAGDVLELVNPDTYYFTAVNYKGSSKINYLSFKVDAYTKTQGVNKVHKAIVNGEIPVPKDAKNLKSVDKDYYEKSAFKYEVK